MGGEMGSHSADTHTSRGQALRDRPQELAHLWLSMLTAYAGYAITCLAGEPPEVHPNAQTPLLQMCTQTHGHTQTISLLPHLKQNWCTTEEPRRVG